MAKTITDIVLDYIAEHPNCKFMDLAVLPDLAKVKCGDIWAALNGLVRSNDIYIEGPLNQETFRVVPASRSLIATVQYMMAYAFPKLDSPDKDKQGVFDEIRKWALEYEENLWNLPRSKREVIVPQTSLEEFCAKKLNQNQYDIEARHLAEIFSEGKPGFMEIVLPVHGALCCNRIVDGEDRSVVVHCGCNGDWHYAINIPEEEFDDLDRVSEALEWFDTK